MLRNVLPQIGWGVFGSLHLGVAKWLSIASYGCGKLQSVRPV